MEYSLINLIDVEKTEELFQGFLAATGIPAAIIDLNGVVLVSSPWQRICTDFHRVNEETCRRCIESDTRLANDALEGKRFSLYRCLNGLIDAASPITIEGKHLANAFIGQFFTSEPDTEFFRRQAVEYGFDEAAYLDALSEIPVVAEESLPAILTFLTSFAEMIASLGLKELRQIEVEKELRRTREHLEVRVRERTQELREANEKLRREIAERKMAEEELREKAALLDLAHDAIFVRDTEDRVAFWNRGAEKTYGWTKEEAMGKPVLELLQSRFPSSFRDIAAKVLESGEWEGELQHRIRKGNYLTVASRWAVRRDSSGNPTGFLEINRDVSERKKAEEALFRREQEYRALAENSPDVIVRLDRELRHLYVNSSLEVEFGKKPRELIGKTAEEAGITEDFCSTHGQICRTVFETGVEQRGDFTNESPDGVKHYESRVVPEFTVEGSVESILIVTRDITERKETEQALIERESLIRKVLETLPVGVWITDRAGKILSGNTMGQKNWAGARYVGIDDYGEYRGWWADTGEPIQPEEWAVARAVTKGETSLNELVEIECFDGSHKIVLNSAAPILNPEGDIIGAIIVNQDVTELRKIQEALQESQDLLETTFESLGDALLLIEPVTRVILSCNSASERVFGYAREEMIGRNVQILHVNRSMYEQFGEELTSSLDAKGMYQAEFCMKRKDGTVFPTEHTVTEIRDASGRRDKVVALIRDASTRKEAEEKIKTYTRKLEESNLALQEFASVASHDLQEPLRKVTAFGGRLKEKYGLCLGEQGNDFLERMLSATGRMQLLLESLLDYSRVTTRAEPFRQVDLSCVVREVLSDLEVRIERTGGAVNVGDLPTVDADLTQMRQLFQNLIGNSLKYHRNGVSTVVRVRSIPCDAGRYRIEVEDNGIGFEQEYAEKIFAPFLRLHGRSSGYEGTGMGLAICKKIVERHGGTITARSKPGEGATFIINLPVMHGTEHFVY